MSSGGPGWSRRPGGCGATPALPQADISGSFHSRKMFDLYSSYLLTQSEHGSATVAAAAPHPTPPPPPRTQREARVHVQQWDSKNRGVATVSFVFSGEVFNLFVLLFTVAFPDLDQRQQGLSASARTGRLNQSAIQLSAVIDWNAS